MSARERTRGSGRRSGGGVRRARANDSARDAAAPPLMRDAPRQRHYAAYALPPLIFIFFFRFLRYVFIAADAQAFSRRLSFPRFVFFRFAAFSPLRFTPSAALMPYHSTYFFHADSHC
jgi:hypothetical protein